MERDYGLLVEKLKKRRYDEALREHVLSEAFHQSGYSDCLKYILESMVEIDASYAYKVYASSRKIHETLSKSLKKMGYDVDYRYQGALKTYTNILLYGDVEIVVIKKNVSKQPHKDMQSLAAEILNILSKDNEYKSIDYSDKTRIRIIAQKPTCEIDILPSMWVNSAEYLKTRNEIYRGITEFDFKSKKVKKYLPFLNIARINSRDNHTNGNFKALSRLLKTIKADHPEHIHLRESEINGILYNIPKVDLTVPQSKVLSLLPLVKATLNKLSSDNSYFNGILAPSEKDRIFGGRPEKQAEIRKLAASLSSLVQDLEKELESINKTLDSEIPYL